MTSSSELDRVRAKYRQERDKRQDPHRRDLLDLRGHEELLADPYTPVADREPATDTVDALVVGAGWGGLMAAAHLRKAGIERIRVVDKAGDVGGGHPAPREPADVGVPGASRDGVRIGWTVGVGVVGAVVGAPRQGRWCSAPAAGNGGPSAAAERYPPG